MKARRLLGIDFGSKRVGLAVSDSGKKIASPLLTFARRDRAQDAQLFQKLVADQEIAELVVGLPLHMSGEEGPKAGEAREYGQWLHDVTGLPVVYWDERCTTVEAEEQLWAAGLTHKQRKDRRDRVAAQVILQSYLDAGCPNSRPQGEPPA